MQNILNNTTWKWIKNRLALYDLNFNKISAIYKVHRTCFTGLKNKPCPKFESILAKHLRIEPWVLWPDRYDAAHNPSRVSSRYQGHKYFSMEKINDGK